MKVLITGASSPLSRELAQALGKSHVVRLTDRVDVSTMHEFIRSDLDHDESTNRMVRGMDVIVHSGEPPRDASPSDQLDAAMRGTYNLLWAAWEEGVRKVVYLSSLSVMSKYDERFAVTEQWKPTPTTDPATLCYHMGEFVCREFARENKLSVVSLRLGDIVWEGAGAASTSDLYLDDLAQAVEKALSVEVMYGWSSAPTSWNVFHVQSSVANQRFLTNTARETLGFEPASRE